MATNEFLIFMEGDTRPVPRKSCVLHSFVRKKTSADRLAEHAEITLFLAMKRATHAAQRACKMKNFFDVSAKFTLQFLDMFKAFNEGHEAFAKVYRKFSQPLRQYVRSKISDPEIAEELTQEVFLKAYRFRDSYQERYALSTWLWTIARNTVTDHLRGSRLEDSGLESEELACERPCAESVAMRKDERKTYLRMLRSLTRMQKRVIWMRVIHQLSYEEISKRLDMSLSAVKNLAYRAKLSLNASFSGSMPALASI
jgi:RNA polymerase sigma-70 factor (ECF subfamily)